MLVFTLSTHTHTHTLTQTYINTVSSPKSIAIVNVDTRSSLGTSESIIATQYLLQQTLTNSDYFTVFAPGFNRTSAFGSAEFIKATPEHIEQVLDMLQNQTAEAIDYGLITEALLALNSSENCYKALIVASSARNLANQELGDAILAGYDGTMSFPIILYALGMGAEFDRTYSGVPYCSSNTALLEVTSNTSYYGYLNYFVDGKKGATFYIHVCTRMYIANTHERNHACALAHTHTHTHTHRVITCRGYNLPIQQCTTNQYISNHCLCPNS